MEVVEETRSKSDYNLTHIEKLNNISKLSFDFDYKNRFIYCSLEDDSNLIIETSFLKVLKPIHISNSRKKNLSKKYMILELSGNVDDNENFYLEVIDKIHELCQYNIKKNSLSWFNSEFDDFTLDMKVRRPIDMQKNTKFIKLLIDEENILEKIENLDKNTYVSCKLKFNGLKINSDHLIEEWELINYITQEEYESEYNNNENMNDKSITEYLTENLINNSISKDEEPVIQDQVNNEKLEEYIEKKNNELLENQNKIQNVEDEKQSLEYRDNIISNH